MAEIIFNDVIDGERNYGYFTVFDLNDVVQYLEDWCSNIYMACYLRSEHMAKTVADAKSQCLTVPDYEKWVDFALLLDGERISEELDYPLPGEFDVIMEYPADSQDGDIADMILHARLDLYCKLRYLQSITRKPTMEEAEQIKNTLNWIGDALVKVK